MSDKTNPFNQVLRPELQVLWQALAFHAGYLNAGGFLSSHRFVSHMTGFGSQVGVSVSEGDHWIALEMLFAPISFIIGAGYAGHLVDRKIVNNREPRVMQGLMVIMLLNTIVFVGGVSGWFGTFGEPLLLQRDFLLLFILTFICGLQNGLFVSLTSGQIRTTHITGLATDIGLNIVKIFSTEEKDYRKVEKRKNKLRMKTVLSFFAGSFVAASIFRDYEYWGFLGSAFISVGLYFFTHWVQKVNLHKSMEDKPITVG